MATDTYTPRTPSPDASAARAAVSDMSQARVVVLGGGVAGLTVADELRRHLGARADITLLSESEVFRLGPALLWVPFGRQAATIGFPIRRALERRGIRFANARADRIDTGRRVVRARYIATDDEIPYDYLVIATGPRADSAAIPGIAGQLGATAAIWTESGAVEARRALGRFLERLGPAVVGAAQGTAYLGAAYEFALSLDHALRRAGKRDAAPITFVTPEPALGHTEFGGAAARRALERLFAERHIAVRTSVTIERVERDSVLLQDGEKLPAAFTMIMPPFGGVSGVWASPGLTDEHGFVPVGRHYQHTRYPEIYAVGTAARIVAPPEGEGEDAELPKTGYLAAAMAKVAARDLAAAIAGSAPAARALPRLRDLRIIDGGDGGLLLLTVKVGRLRHAALPLPGRTAHRAKAALARYLLWKLRTGRSYLP